MTRIYQSPELHDLCWGEFCVKLNIPGFFLRNSVGQYPDIWFSCILVFVVTMVLKLWLR